MATGTHDDVLFREVQYFRQPWLWLLVLGVSAVTLYGMVQQIFLSKPFGNNPASDAVLIVIVVVFGFCFPLLFYLLNLKTEVRGDGLYYRFFPFHLSVQRIPLEDLKSFEARTYSPLREYGGWGIRWGSGGKAYNVAGNRGVQVELASGQRIMIGSRRAQEFADALALAVDRNGTGRK
jgi:hypothetical protein